MGFGFGNKGKKMYEEWEIYGLKHVIKKYGFI